MQLRDIVHLIIIIEGFNEITFITKYVLPINFPTLIDITPSKLSKLSIYIIPF